MNDLIDPRIQSEGTVLVGIEGMYYYVQRSRLEGHGPAFESALRTVTSDRNIPIAKLDSHKADFSSGIIRAYLSYLKSGQIEPIASLEPDDQEATLSVDMADIIEGYLFAERLRDTEGQDDYMDAALSAYQQLSTPTRRWLPTLETVTTVYRLTYAPSVMRDFLVDVHTWAGQIGPFENKDIADYFEALPATEFLTELNVALDRQLPGESIRTLMAEATRMPIRCYNDTSNLTTNFRQNRAYAVLPTNMKKMFGACNYHQHDSSQRPDCRKKKRKRAADDDGGRANKR